MVNIFQWINPYFSKFVQLISLSTPLSRIIVLCSGVFVLTILPTEKLYLLPIRSIWGDVFHIQMYSIGLTRATSYILHGKFEQAWQMNPLAFLCLTIITILIIKDLVYLVRTKDFSI